MADKKRTVVELEQRRQDLMAELRELAEEINQRAGEEDAKAHQTEAIKRRESARTTKRVRNDS